MSFTSSSSSPTPSRFYTLFQGIREFFTPPITEAPSRPTLIPTISNRIFKANTLPSSLASPSDSETTILHLVNEDQLVIAGKRMDINDSQTIYNKILKLTDRNEELAHKIINYISQNHAELPFIEIQDWANLNGKHLLLGKRPSIIYHLDRFPGVDEEHPIITLNMSMRGDISEGSIHDDQTNDDYVLNRPVSIVVKEQINFSTNTSEIYYKAEFSSQVLSIYKEEQRYSSLIDSTLEKLETVKYWEFEGIGRLSGSADVIESFNSNILKKPITDLTNDLGHIEDVHALLVILKSLIKNRNLIPSHLLHTFKGIAMDIDTTPPTGSERTKNYLKQVINSLPPTNRELLQKIVDFSLKIARNSDINRMDIHNIAIVFGPNIFQLPEGDDPMTTLTDTLKLNELFAFILANRDFLFDSNHVAGTSGS